MGDGKFNLATLEICNYEEYEKCPQQGNYGVWRLEEYLWYTCGYEIS